MWKLWKKPRPQKQKQGSNLRQAKLAIEAAQLLHTVHLSHLLAMIIFIIKQTIEAGSTSQYTLPIICNTLDPQSALALFLSNINHEGHIEGHCLLGIMSLLTSYNFQSP
jgi:hypothetical protein